jgi:hypothetical protein
MMRLLFMIVLMQTKITIMLSILEMIMIITNTIMIIKEQNNEVITFIILIIIKTNFNDHIFIK